MVIAPAAEPQSAAPGSLPETAATDIAPTTPQYDATGEKIFIPGRGWMVATEFWDLYEHDPRQLPDDLDFQAIHDLRDQAGDGRAAAAGTDQGAG
ncbi:MAG: hypothetical protein R3E86_14020 [Pseudomonadales bacterium]